MSGRTLRLFQKKRHMTAAYSRIALNVFCTIDQNSSVPQLGPMHEHIIIVMTKFYDLHNTTSKVFFNEGVKMIKGPINIERYPEIYLWWF